MSQDTFFDYPQTIFNCSQGEVKLPIFYYDVSSVLAFYLTDYKKVQKLVEPLGFMAARFLNGKAMVGFAFYEYRKTDVGSYNEVGLATAIYAPDRPRPLLSLPQLKKNVNRRKMGFYIHHLPVTTAIANAAGREIYGFPKFVTELPFELTDSHFKGIVKDEQGKEIVTLEGKVKKGIRMSGFDLLLYSYLDKNLMRTVVDVKARFNTSFFPDWQLTLGKGDHPMRQTIKDMGITGKKPFIVQTTHHFRSRLHRGEETSNIG
ncbi:MAG TPA: hypothetical protein EYP36_07795 [Calditrichaeota bacterium]|nr:hypothetical protein [Calditrichota bacterium]